MPTRLARFRAFYGAHPLHLLALLASFALVAYVFTTVGPTSLWSSTWWQSILVWFLGAVLLHDVVLFPLYALADMSLAAGVRAMRGHRTSPSTVPALNYVRIPAMASGLLFLLFFPGIIKQGADTYLAATGQTQAPFLHRWLLLTAIAFALGAVAYAARLGLAPDRSPPSSQARHIDPPGLSPQAPPPTGVRSVGRR